MSRLQITDDADPNTIFEVLAKLGEGSYGAVYKALDKRDGEMVAIKVIEVSEDTSSLEKEIGILSQCNSEFVVRYKGAFKAKTGSAIWICMEYCGAGSVCDFMAICSHRFSESEIGVIMKMSLLGLDYLHEERKIIHRDIKSGNILLTHNGDCKLADFGVSAQLTNTIKHKTVIGTPYWMAPEVLQSLEYNGKADIWSLAITAYELAVGEPPLANVHPMRAIFMIPNAPPPTIPRDQANKWSPEFHDFLATCLVKNPEQRPTARHLLQTHPFIVKALGKPLLRRLVENCMAQIDEYREEEVREAVESQGQNQNNQNQNNDNNNGTIQSNRSFSVAGVSSGASTMILNNTSSSSSSSVSDSGTVIINTSTMKHLRETKKGVTTLASSRDSTVKLKINNNNNHNNNNGTSSAVNSDTVIIRDLYKTAVNLECLVNPHSGGGDANVLAGVLASLQVAHDEERARLDSTYENAKRQVADKLASLKSSQAQSSSSSSSSSAAKK